MINATRSLVEAIYNDDIRDYGILISVRKTPDTATADYTFTNPDIKSGGLIIESTASGEDEFPLGKCIMRKLTVTILNASAYDGYNFVKKWLVLAIGYPNPDVVFGRFRVASQSYDGNFITLVAYDAMCRLDAKFTGVTTPITAYALMQAMIPMIGWSGQTSPFRLTSAQTTELQGVTFSKVPTDEDLTCRNVLEYMLQFFGYNLKTNSPSDEYVLSWYDLSVVEGVTPTDEYTAELNGYALIRYPYSLNMERQDRMIDGVRWIYYDTTEANVAQERTYLLPETLNPLPGFVITVEGNPMEEDYSAQPLGYNSNLMTRIYDRYAGAMYRKASFAHVEDPRLEAGDVGLLLDSEGNYHPIIISGTRFQIQNMQNSYSSTSVMTNSIAFSTQTKTVSTAYNLSKVNSDANATLIATLQTDVGNVGTRVTALEAEDFWHVQRCNYSYTCPASGSVNVTKNQLGVSVPTGFTIIGYTSISTANADVVPRSWNAQSSATGTSIVLRNLTSSQKTGTLTVDVLSMKTSRQQP